MRIGELSQKADCDVETIRYYEREGLLKAPAREANGYRSYGSEHLVQLRGPRPFRRCVRRMPQATTPRGRSPPRARCLRSAADRAA